MLKDLIFLIQLKCMRIHFMIFGVDAVTISPYMGKDAVTPFLVKDKFVVLLAATSNENSSHVQNIQTQSGLLFMQR